MKIQLVEGVEVHRGSGDVFADLGLVNADKLKIKTGLVIEIRKAMRTRGLTQQEAAKLMGVTQPKVSDMMRGDFTNLSERKLMDCLTRLGYDIEISVRPSKAEVGFQVNRYWNGSNSHRSFRRLHPKRQQLHRFFWLL